MADALVQAHVDEAVKERATAVLEGMGLTISDAVRILLRRTADEGTLPFALESDAAHDAWFRAKVRAALDDPRPAVPHDEVEAYFTSRKDAARRKTGAGGA